jgi:hypothetical protein
MIAMLTYTLLPQAGLACAVVFGFSFGYLFGYSRGWIDRDGMDMGTGKRAKPRATAKALAKLWSLALGGSRVIRDRIVPWTFAPSAKEPA